MGYISKGRRLMAFVDSATLALATNHTLTVSASTIEEPTKDDGDENACEIDYTTWNVTSENIVGRGDNMPREHSIVDMIDAMLELRVLSVYMDASLPGTGSIPDDGWVQDPEEILYPTAGGQAYIESLSISAGSSGYATASVSFKGVGEITSF